MDPLARTLEFFFGHPEHCRIMGEKAREHFLRNYHYKMIIPRLEGLWDKAKSAFTQDRRKFPPDPLAMDIFHCFAHYVSQMLSPESMVQLTEFGERFLSSSLRYPLLAEMANLVDFDEAKRIRARLTSPSPLGGILGKDDENSWKAQYLIAWMLKHDLLKIHGAWTPGSTV